MPLGKALQIPGAAAAAEDAQDRHQQQQPLGVTHPSALTASPAGPAGRRSDRDWQKAGTRDESSPDKTGTSMAAPAALCLTFSRPWRQPPDRRPTSLSADTRFGNVAEQVA